MTVTDSSPPPPGRDSLTDDLLWRGLIQDSTDLDELRDAARRRPGHVLCGLRPDRAEPARRPPHAGRSPPAGSSSPGTGRCCWSAAPPARSATRRRAPSGRSTRPRWSPAGWSASATSSRPFVIVHRRQRGAAGQQPGLDRRDVGDRVPARRRQALPGQQDAGPRGGEGPAGDRHQLHRVQLPAAAGQRLLRAAPPARLPAAVRRLRPVGQHHRRRGLRPPAGRRAGAGVHHAAGDQGRRHEVRQDRGRRGLARPRR